MTLSPLLILALAAPLTGAAAPPDPPELPPSTISQGDPPVPVLPYTYPAGRPADELGHALGTAQDAARKSSAGQRARRAAAQAAREDMERSDPIARAVAGVYRHAARLAERYAKDSMAMLPARHMRARSLAGVLENIVRSPHMGRSSDGSINYVSPGTEHRYFGGTDAGGFNVGGLGIGGSGGRSDGYLAIALDAANSDNPQKCLWSLKRSKRRLNELRDELAAHPAETPEQAAWIAGATRSLDDLNGEIEMAVPLARNRYLEKEQQLPPLKRKMRAFLFGEP